MLNETTKKEVKEFITGLSLISDKNGIMLDGSNEFSYNEYLKYFKSRNPNAIIIDTKISIRRDGISKDDIPRFGLRFLFTED